MRATNLKGWSTRFLHLLSGGSKLFSIKAFLREERACPQCHVARVSICVMSRETILPFFPDLHVELAKSWNKPYSSRVFEPATSISLTIVGAKAQGYTMMPEVEETLVGYLSPGIEHSISSVFHRSQTVLWTRNNIIMSKWWQKLLDKLPNPVVSRHSLFVLLVKCGKTAKM